jgi:ABC-type branched-subunit amino acid transport system substrate-binding protein
MSPADLADLIAYLKRLGVDRERGISEESVTVGMIIPTRGQLANLGEAVKAVTRAYFEELNDKGGIYNRKINLKFAETGNSSAETSAIARRFVQDESVFALTSPFIAGADEEIATLMKELEVPAVGPLTLEPQVGHPLNRYVFYLLSGLAGQTQVLINFASRQSPDLKTGLLIVYPENASKEMLIKAIGSQCTRDGCGPIEQVSYPSAMQASALADKLSRTRKDVVFFLGSDEEALALVNEADKLQWSPTFYFPGGLGANNLFSAPQSFKHKFLLSLPASPSDQTPQGIAEFRALAAKYNLPRNHLASQMLALSAAKILAEGLKQSGRDLTVENLIAALERLNEYQTGLTPPITYGPNRRLGAAGAYVVLVDLDKKEFVPAGPWVKLD